MYYFSDEKDEDTCGNRNIQYCYNATIFNCDNGTES